MNDPKNSKSTTNPAVISILTAAAAFGDIKKMAQVLNLGVSVDSKNSWGKTPLFNAVSAQEKEAAEFLIMRGADLNLRSDSGGSPLHSAVYNYARGVDQYCCALLLLKQKANPRIGDSEVLTPREMVEVHYPEATNSDKIIKLLKAFEIEDEKEKQSKEKPKNP